MDDVREKIGALTAKIDAAHKRVDKLESDVRDNLKEMNAELKTLNAHMNKGKGWASAILLLAGTSGAGLTKLIEWLGTK